MDNQQNTVEEQSKLLQIPVLALRGMVVFPGMMLHFDVGRRMSARAIEHAMETDQHILIVSQKEIETDKPTLDDLYSIGVVAEVKQILKQP